VAVEGVDYAWSRPDPAGLYAAGKRFASRYLSYDRTGKNLTLAEAEQLAAAGIAVVANWEWQTGDAKGGYDTGRKYAQEAVRLAAACGMPNGRPIYFSVDYDPGGAYDAVDAYFQGIASVMPVGQIGAYGSYDTIGHLLDAGLIRWAWQTYAWSGGRWHPGAHVQQYHNGVLIAGGDLDLNRAMVADFGQWKPGQEGDDVSAEEVWAHPLAQNVDGVQKVYPAGDWLKGANVAAWEARNILADTVLPALARIEALLKKGGGQPPAGPVDLTPEAIKAVADATADEIAADPERDGAGT
jgi:hypothetical protein